MIRFFSRKTAIVLLVQVMMLLWFSVPTREFSADIGWPASPWICVFYFTNPFFAMVWQLCVIFFFSDAPFLRYHEMYRMIRLGRKRWFRKMLGYIVFSSAALFFLETGLSVFFLASRGMEWSWDWGRLLYTLAMTNVSSEYDSLAVFPYRLMTSYTPVEALLLLAFVSISLNILTAEVIAATGLLGARAVGTGVVFGLAMYIVVERNLSRGMPEVLYLSPYSWLNLDRIGTNAGYQVTLPYVLVFLIIGELLLPVLWGRIYRKADLTWTRED
ncbi:MAG: hypothetical protein Q4C65_07670 [Eubacteriales bacterium]|nr:hypothetical protein [Eubacteriales bacterium]